MKRVVLWYPQKTIVLVILDLGFLDLVVVLLEHFFLQLFDKKMYFFLLLLKFLEK